MVRPESCPVSRAIYLGGVLNDLSKASLVDLFLTRRGNKVQTQIDRFTGSTSAKLNMFPDLLLFILQKNSAKRSGITAVEVEASAYFIVLAPCSPIER